MPQIEIHADDYAISPHSSEDILNCLRAGKLDGVSVLTNMSCFEEYAAKLKAEYDSFPRKPRLTVHLNFMYATIMAVNPLPSAVIVEIV